MLKKLTIDPLDENEQVLCKAWFQKKNASLP